MAPQTRKTTRATQRPLNPPLKASTTRRQRADAEDAVESTSTAPSSREEPEQQRDERSATSHPPRVGGRHAKASLARKQEAERETAEFERKEAERQRDELRNDRPRPSTERQTGASATKKRKREEQEDDSRKERGGKARKGKLAATAASTSTLAESSDSYQDDEIPSSERNIGQNKTKHQEEKADEQAEHPGDDSDTIRVEHPPPSIQQTASSQSKDKGKAVEEIEYSSPSTRRTPSNQNKDKGKAIEETEHSLPSTQEIASSQGKGKGKAVEAVETENETGGPAAKVAQVAREGELDESGDEGTTGAATQGTQQQNNQQAQQGTQAQTTEGQSNQNAVAATPAVSHTSRQAPIVVNIRSTRQPAMFFSRKCPPAEHPAAVGYSSVHREDRIFFYIPKGHFIHCIDRHVRRLPTLNKLHVNNIDLGLGPNYLELPQNFSAAFERSETKTTTQAGSSRDVGEGEVRLVIEKTGFLWLEDTLRERGRVPSAILRNGNSGSPVLAHGTGVRSDSKLLAVHRMVVEDETTKMVQELRIGEVLDASQAAGDDESEELQEWKQVTVVSRR